MNQPSLVEMVTSAGSLSTAAMEKFVVAQVITLDTEGTATSSGQPCSRAQVDELSPAGVSCGNPVSLRRIGIGHIGQRVHPDVLQVMRE